MPLPGESITAIYELLTDALELLERTPKTEEDRQEIQNLITKAQSRLSAEEMEVIRFGDLTRTADHTYEPYRTIKQVVEVLKDFQVPNFEVDGHGNKEEDEDGDYSINCWEEIEVLTNAVDILDTYIESDHFPTELLTNQPELIK